MFICAAETAAQGKQVLEKGIGRASEVEEDVSDPAAARGWLQHPSRMLEASPLCLQLQQ
jgi:hypothetical protein